MTSQNKAQFFLDEYQDKISSTHTIHRRKVYFLKPSDTNLKPISEKIALDLYEDNTVHFSHTATNAARKVMERE